MTSLDLNKFWNSNNIQSFFKFPFDASALLETQQKNAQALAEAQKLAFEGWQSVLQRQSELASQLWQEQSSFAKELLTEGTPEQKTARQVEFARKNFETSVENWNELSELVSGNSKEASDLLAGRVSASLAEFKSAIAAACKTSAAANCSVASTKEAA